MVVLGSGGTTVDAYSKLETDNLLNAKVDDVEFTPIKALAESNEINITYLANNKAEKNGSKRTFRISR